MNDSPTSAELLRQLLAQERYDTLKRLTVGAALSIFERPTGVLAELYHMGACAKALQWVEDHHLITDSHTRRHLWDRCTRGDWMLFYLLRSARITSHGACRLLGHVVDIDAGWEKHSRSYQWVRERQDPRHAPCPQVNEQGEVVHPDEWITALEIGALCDELQDADELDLTGLEDLADRVRISYPHIFGRAPFWDPNTSQRDVLFHEMCPGVDVFGQRLELSRSDERMAECVQATQRHLALGTDYHTRLAGAEE